MANLKDFKGNKKEVKIIKTESKLAKVSKSIEEWRKYCEYWLEYPDKFIDKIRPDDCKIDLYPYQRIFLRVIFRYRKVFITATRGTAKSFTEILAFYLLCIMCPGTKLCLTAPGKEQASKIAQANIENIWEYYPTLFSEVKHHSFAKDYTKIKFKNGSVLDIVQILDSARGGRRNGVATEEIADPHFNQDAFNEIVLPLMANNRIATCGGVSPFEVHKREIYVTTAGTRQSFAFEKMKEILMDMEKGDSFCLGTAYELPCMYGQLELDYVLEKKESPTFNPLSFAREYGSVWTGSSDKSLVGMDDLNKCRVITNAEEKACSDEDVEYILSYDVARSEGQQNANCSLVVVKKIPRGDGTFQKHVVNIYAFEGTRFYEQALFIKQKVNDFKAKVIIIDTNGLGVGLVDQLTMDIDENPPYSVINDERYDKYKTADSIPMVFAIKAQQKETKNSDMVNVFMSIIANHKVKLLKSETFKTAELKKENSKIENDMEKLQEQLLPFIMTDLLFDEVMNLEYKQSGNTTTVKQISKGINKDRYSALLYAIFYIYLEERQEIVKMAERIQNVDYNVYASLFN